MDRFVIDLGRLQEEQRVQFTRLAQLQAEVDAIRRARDKMRTPI